MAKQVTCTEVLVLSESGNEKVRIVKWNGGEPKLEKRSFYEKDGVEMPGKARGLSLEDVQMVLERGDEIVNAMGGVV